MKYEDFIDLQGAIREELLTALREQVTEEARMVGDDTGARVRSVERRKETTDRIERLSQHLILFYLFMRVSGATDEESWTAVAAAAPDAWERGQK